MTPGVSIMAFPMWGAPDWEVGEKHLLTLTNAGDDEFDHGVFLIKNRKEVGDAVLFTVSRVLNS